MMYLGRVRADGRMAPHWGTGQLEEGLSVKDQEGVCQGGTVRTGSWVEFVCDVQALLEDGSQGGRKSRFRTTKETREQEA